MSAEEKKSDTSAERFDEVEEELSQVYGKGGKDKLEALWKEIDFNGNGKVSLAEIDKLVVAKYSVLNNKPALMMAYKKTTQRDGDGDAYVETKEFRALLKNILYFTKLWDVFDDIDTGDDRRVDLGEFCSGCARLNLDMTVPAATAAFDVIDRNGGGQILFAELCRWVAEKNLADDMDLDVTGSTGNDQIKA